MAELIISVSGLRGVVGESLTPEVLLRYVCAYADGLGSGAVVLGRDGRTTGRMVADLVRGTLLARGRDVIDVDVAATPTLGVAVRSCRAAGGVQISASHNPPEYNGIKLFDATGKVLAPSEGEQVVARYLELAGCEAPGGETGSSGPRRRWSSFDRIGSALAGPDVHRAHADLVLSCVDARRIRERRFRILLDSNHGAGGLLGRRLLEELSCEVVLLGDVPNGQFAHPPEPTAENLDSVRRRVVESRATLGFCQDPDADRLAVIDESGRYVGEEFTLALCLDHVLRQRRGLVVTNCATSRMCEDIATQHGCTFARTAVGEANVVARMQAEQAVFGGEGNGGPIDPRVGFVRDSFVGMALILDGLACRTTTLGAWVDSLPRYVIHKTRIELARERVPTVLDALGKHFSDAVANRMDGLRLDWADRWLLVRGSNTEPIVRVIAEAPDLESAEELCREAASVAR